MAKNVLHGVGDATRGEWREQGDIAWHLRRRLSETEEAQVGPVVDVRTTWEGTKRRQAVRRYLPVAMQRLPLEQLP